MHNDQDFKQTVHKQTANVRIIRHEQIVLLHTDCLVGGFASNDHSMTVAWQEGAKHNFLGYGCSFHPTR